MTHNSTYRYNLRSKVTHRLNILAPFIQIEIDVTEKEAIGILRIVKFMQTRLIDTNNTNTSGVNYTMNQLKDYQKQY